MLASDIITLGAAIFGLLTSIAGSSVCIYNSYRTSRINLSILKVKVHNLEILIEGLQQKLNGFDVIKPDPCPWIREARKFLEGVNIPDLENHLNDNVCYRYGAVKSIEEKLQELDVLLENVKQIAQQIKVKGSKQPEVSLVDSAREDIQQKIWELVKSVETTGTVCIHGIAGVGKSALAAVIHNKVLIELAGFESIVCVKANDNILDYDMNFNHLVEHALECTLDDNDKDVSKCVGLKFGSFDEVLLYQSNKV